MPARKAHRQAQRLSRSEAQYLSHLFHRPGDARAAAASFPAVAELRRFLSLPPAPDSLDSAAGQARQTVDLITAILTGREIWRFERGNS